MGWINAISLPFANTFRTITFMIPAERYAGVSTSDCGGRTRRHCRRTSVGVGGVVQFGMNPPRDDWGAELYYPGAVVK